MRRIIACIGLIFSFTAGISFSQQSSDIAAVVTKIKGTLMAVSPGSEKWLSIKEGEFLNEGDKLKTGSQDMATITFVNGIEVKLNKQSVFTINVTEISNRGKGNVVSLSVGQAWCRILKEGTQFDIETPAATVAIRGSAGDTRVRKNGRTDFILYFGKAYVENEYGKVTMKPGSKTTISVGSAPEEPQIISESDEEDWQEGITSAYLQLELEKQDAVVGYPVRVTVHALDDEGNVNTSAQSKVRIISNNKTVAFSKSKSGKDRSKILDIKLSRGNGSFWAFPLERGSMVIIAKASGYSMATGRLFAFQPSKKSLEMEIEDNNGKKKKIKLKFRR